MLAPHGSGKGVTFVIPTLLTLNESCIVHDIKLENHQLTSGYRKSIGHKIFIFNPLENKTHRYNPLDFISKDPKQKINDLQKIADLLIDENDISKILFIGLALYSEAINTKNTIGKITRIINSDMEQELLDGLKKISSSNQCVEILKGFLKQPSHIKNAAIDHLRSALYLWINPLIDYATSESDFDIAQLKTSKVTIYVGLNPTDIERLKPLMRLFYHHAFERLIKTAEVLGYGEENGGVTIILDEFYSIGKIAKYAFGYLRGYKVRLFSIASDIQKIQDVYGKKVSILNDNFIKIFFGANDRETAEYISSLCIDKNEEKELFSWQQIISMSQELQIVLIDKEQPIMSKKIKYYDDAELKLRITDPAEIFI